MDGFEKAISLLPPRLRQAVLPFGDRQVEEIRLRIDRRPSLLFAGGETALDTGRTSNEDIRCVLEKATGASLHSAAPALREGYISCMGLRVGVCGRGVIQKGELTGFRDFSSLALRIPRECRGACDRVIHQMYKNGFENTLILSPPGVGKTTALRELIRRLSDEGMRVGVVDERNELAAADGNGAGFDLGACSDVLTGVAKVQGAMMLLRGMNPQIIALDEISSPGDAVALEQICGCGVGLLASAHAAGREELERRPVYRRMLELGIFSRTLTIHSEGGRRSYRTEVLRC